jgi:hypothetical protein
MVARCPVHVGVQFLVDEVPAQIVVRSLEVAVHRQHSSARRSCAHLLLLDRFHD